MLCLYPKNSSEPRSYSTIDWQDFGSESLGAQISYFIWTQYCHRISNLVVSFNRKVETGKMQPERSIPIGSNCYNIINERTDDANMRRYDYFRLRWFGSDSHNAIYTILCCNDIGMGSGLKNFPIFDESNLIDQLFIAGGPNIATEGRSHFQQLLHFQHAICDIQTIHQGEVEEEGQCSRTFPFWFRFFFYWNYFPLDFLPWKRYKVFDQTCEPWGITTEVWRYIGCTGTGRKTFSWFVPAVPEGIWK